jgi:hypothetical protein
MAMRFEFIGRQRAVSTEERDYFRCYKEPSDAWYIWIARFSGDDAHDHWARRYTMRIDPLPDDSVPRDDCKASVFTFVIGKLCAHLFYSPVMKFSDYVGGGTENIWKIWPPSNFYMDSHRIPIIASPEVLDLHEAIARWADERAAEAR